MSSYSKNEMMTMQQDAIRRVKEMQRRAMQNISPPASQNPASGIKKQSDKNLKPENQEQKQDDRMLVLALIILLISEKAPMEIILALLYIIM